MGSQFWSKPTNISVLILLVLRHTKITTFFFSFFKSNFIKCCFDLNDRARLSRPLDWGYRASESQMWPPGSSSCPQRKLLWWKVRGGGEVVSDVTLSLEHVFSKASDRSAPHQLTASDAYIASFTQRHGRSQCSILILRMWKSSKLP